VLIHQREANCPTNSNYGLVGSDSESRSNELGARGQRVRPSVHSLNPVSVLHATCIEG
jgi:hypothetical protein